MPNNIASRLKTESGQAVVIVLLSLSVVLTIVLFVLSRSITDISSSTKQADAVRAFSAAEAGIETALITGAGTTGNVTIGDASYSVDVKSDATQTFNYPIPLLAGDTTTIWFMSHTNEGELTCEPEYPSCYTGNVLNICWGSEGTNAGDANTPAVELSLYYESTPGVLSSIKVARAVYDPNTTRTSNNLFESASTTPCQIEGVTYAFQKAITLSALGGNDFNNNGLVMAKLRMIYNSSQAHYVGVSVASSGQTLPSQGLEITSTGYSSIDGSIESQSNRRVSVFKGWPEFPLSGLAVYTPYGVSK